MALIGLISFAAAMVMASLVMRGIDDNINFRCTHYGTVLWSRPSYAQIGWTAFAILIIAYCSFVLLVGIGFVPLQGLTAYVTAALSYVVACAWAVHHNHNR